MALPTPRPILMVDRMSPKAQREMERVVHVNYLDPSVWAEICVQVTRRSSLEEKMRFSGVDGVSVVEFIFRAMMEAESPDLVQAALWDGFKPRSLPCMRISRPDLGELPTTPLGTALWREGRTF